MSPTAATETPFPADSPFPGGTPAAGRCTFLGAGPGDPGLLTLRAVEVLSSADVLVADPLTAAAVRSHCPAGVQVHTPGAEGPEFDLAELVAEAVRSGKHVVRTVDGDPGLDGCAAEEMLGCAGHGIHFEVIPGVAQSVGVPAYAGVPLRGVGGTDVRFVDGAALLMRQPGGPGRAGDDPGGAHHPGPAALPPPTRWSPTAASRSRRSARRSPAPPPASAPSPPPWPPSRRTSRWPGCCPRRSPPRWTRRPR